MSEDGNPVCTYSGANSCKKVRVCDYEYWIKWARLLSPMHNENARKTSSSSTGLPLKSKSVKTWETEVWRWSFLYNQKPIVDLSTYLTTRWSKQGWVKIWNVLLHDRSLWPWPNSTVSKMSDFRLLHFLIWRKIQISAEQACTMDKWQGPSTVNVWRWKSCLYIQRS